MATKPREPKPAAHPTDTANAKAMGTCLLLFCLLGFGKIGVSLRGYLRTQDEVKTMARVNFFKTYSRSASAEYEYTWIGQHFHGKRIGFLDYFEGSEAKLRSAFQSGKLIEIFIDPSDPSYSVVDRTWNWSGFSLYAVLSIASGAGAAYFYRLAVVGALPPDDSRQLRRAEIRRKNKQSRSHRPR